MKSFIIPLISIFILFSSSFANILNPKEVLEIIETVDETRLHDFYQKLDNISLEEAQQFAETLFELVRNKYGNINFSEIRQALPNILSNLDCEPSVLKEAENILIKIIDNLEEKETKRTSTSPYYSLKNVKCNFKKKQEEKNEKISGGIIIGGIETVCGVLLLVTPWKKVGSGLIVDGVRRMLNSTEKIAKENEKKELERTNETTQTETEKSKEEKHFAH